MSASVSIAETIPVTGTCPINGEITEIDVKYRKYHPMGSEHAYAIVPNIDCPEADNGCTFHLLSRLFPSEANRYSINLKIL